MTTTLKDSTLSKAQFMLEAAEQPERLVSILHKNHGNCGQCFAKNIDWNWRDYTYEWAPEPVKPREVWVWWSDGKPRGPLFTDINGARAYMPHNEWEMVKFIEAEDQS